MAQRRNPAEEPERTDDLLTPPQEDGKQQAEEGRTPFAQRLDEAFESFQGGPFKVGSFGIPMLDPEIEAMNQALVAFRSLPPDAHVRVFVWLGGKLGLVPPPTFANPSIVAQDVTSHMPGPEPCSVCGQVHGPVLSAIMQAVKDAASKLS